MIVWKLILTVEFPDSSREEEAAVSSCLQKGATDMRITLWGDWRSSFPSVSYSGT